MLTKVRMPARDRCMAEVDLTDFHKGIEDCSQFLNSYTIVKVMHISRYAADGNEMYIALEHAVKSASASW